MVSGLGFAIEFKVAVSWRAPRYPCFHPLGREFTTSELFLGEGRPGSGHSGINLDTFGTAKGIGAEIHAARLQSAAHITGRRRQADDRLGDILPGVPDYFLLYSEISPGRWLRGPSASHILRSHWSSSPPWHCPYWKVRYSLSSLLAN